METTFEPNIVWTIISALNFLLFIGFVLGVVWAIRRLRAINALERRVSALEARLRQQDQSPPGR